MRNKDYWNSLYNRDDLVFGSAPSGFLVDSIQYLKKGKVLDLACGEGRNAFYLFDNGFEVEGNDFSDVAIAKCKRGVESRNIDFKVQGLDFYLAPIQKYDSVVVIDYKCIPRLLDEIKKGLVVGGTMLLETFTLNHLKNNPDEDLEADECYKPFELVRLLRGWNILFYDERVINNEYKVRVLAKKPSY